MDGFDQLKGWKQEKVKTFFTINIVFFYIKERAIVKDISTTQIMLHTQGDGSYKSGDDGGDSLSFPS